MPPDLASSGNASVDSGYSSTGDFKYHSGIKNLLLPYNSVKQRKDEKRCGKIVAYGIRM